MQVDWKIRIKMSEDRCRSKVTFEFIKCRFCLAGLVESLSFSEENHDRGYNT